LRFEQLLSSSDVPVESDVRGDSLAQIVYTSGTESLPKGVMLPHDAVLWEYVACIADGEIAESDLVLRTAKRASPFSKSRSACFL
jgi:fatty-acyl-CoA synthase